MLITRKALKSSGPSKLCLVISLEDGIKIQYPVVNTAEAIARYKEFIRQNSLLDPFDSIPFSVKLDTFCEAS